MRAHARRLIAVAAATAATAACAKAFRSAPRPTVPPAEAQRLLPEFWSNPGDVTQLDLFLGPGGKELEPRPEARWRFEAKDESGFSPGWDVMDEGGMEWSVKQGPEAQSEVVASRILWALGYRQPATYYVARWSMADGPEAGRPQAPARFRPDPPDRSKAGAWSWERNPFAATQSFRGLLVLMRVLNNWDLLDRNNVVYEFDPPRGGLGRWFVVKDLGASLGKTYGIGSRRSGSRNDLDDYVEQGYIEGVGADGYVDFADLGKWHRQLFGRLAPADVRWTSERLARLTPRQWEDAFRAGGYDAATAAGFIAQIEERVRAGLALPDTRPVGAD